LCNQGACGFVGTSSVVPTMMVVIVVFFPPAVIIAFFVECWIRSFAEIP
jgi:hypothetical protein